MRTVQRGEGRQATRGTKAGETMRRHAKTFNLTITFPTDEARRVFAEWLCDGGGEQSYFDAMEDTATPNIQLDYHGGGGFIADNTIRVQA